MSKDRPDRTFTDEQQQMFGNENAPAPDATRPPAGTQADPVIPGTPESASPGDQTKQEKRTTNKD